MSLTVGLHWEVCQSIKRLYNYSCIKISPSKQISLLLLTLGDLYVLKPSRHLSICKVSDISCAVPLGEARTLKVLIIAHTLRIFKEQTLIRCEQATDCGVCVFA